VNLAIHCKPPKAYADSIGLVRLGELELGGLFVIEGFQESAVGFRGEIVELTGLDAAEVG